MENTKNSNSNKNMTQKCCQWHPVTSWRKSRSSLSCILIKSLKCPATSWQMAPCALDHRADVGRCLENLLTSGPRPFLEFPEHFHLLRCKTTFFVKKYRCYFAISYFFTTHWPALWYNKFTLFPLMAKIVERTFFTSPRSNQIRTWQHSLDSMLKIVKIPGLEGCSYPLFPVVLSMAP